MRVLFVQAGMSLGGHMVSAVTLANALARAGVDVGIASPPGPLVRRIDPGIVHWPIPAPVPIRGSFKAARALRTLVAELGPDVVHAQEHLSTLASWIPSWRNGIPLVATTAGGPVPQYAIPDVDGMVVYSRELYDHFSRDRRWRSRNLTLLEARVDTTLYRRTGDLPLAHPPCVGLVARFTPERTRGVLAAITALGSVAAQGICRVVVGGTGSEQERIRSFVAHLSRQTPGADLRYLGPVEDFPSLLRTLTVFLGYGRTLLEAMSAGVPTVLIGVHGFGGVVSPASVEAMAAYNFSGRHQDEIYEVRAIEGALASALRDHDLLLELSSFSQRFIQERYDVGASAGRLLALYESVAAQKRKRSLATFLCTTGVDAAFGRMLRKARRGRKRRAALKADGAVGR
jgi:glycosyltransferase involved in cell wall biosynthesis